VLKKAGIVVAAAAAGLLAVSPLAFAGEKDDDTHHRHGADTQVNRLDDSNRSQQRGVVNVSADNLALAVQDCNNEISQVAEVTQTITQKLGPLTGVLGLNRSDVEQTATTDNDCYNRAEARDVNTLENDD
jgi:hypothetical protein